MQVNLFLKNLLALLIVIKYSEHKGNVIKCTSEILVHLLSRPYFSDYTLHYTCALTCARENCYVPRKRARTSLQLAKHTFAAALLHRILIKVSCLLLLTLQILFGFHVTLLNMSF